MLKNQRTNHEKVAAFSATLVPILLLILFLPGNSSAKVTGACSNCHTMHNSQGGSDMATYGTGSWVTDEAQPALLRGTCLGCHGMGTANKIETVGGSNIPQVYHTDTTDLAGGNFRHIETGGDDRGHNVSYLENADEVLDALEKPPGGSGTHPGITSANLTCAGDRGCHGKRKGDYPGIAGSHHQNVDGQCDTANEVYNSYRFLYQVKGLENPTAQPAEKWQNVDANSHNEYFGADSPALGEALECTTCHNMSENMEIKAPGNTISGFCGSCHGTFHAVAEIGGTTSPFIRHPTDIVIKNSGEYEIAKRTYNPQAPVGRTTVPASVFTGATANDVVTCLSCHAAHASNYPDMLKWDYDTMNAGGGADITGCFTCHTEKDTGS